MFIYCLLQSVLVYWVCNNFISLGQVSLFKIPAVRDYLEIPAREVPAEYLEKTKLSPKGFKKGVQRRYDF